MKYVEQNLSKSCNHNLVLAAIRCVLLQSIKTEAFRIENKNNNNNIAHMKMARMAKTRGNTKTREEKKFAAKAEEIRESDRERERK